MSGGGDELAEEHEEHVNHEAWVIPYADLLTLLMAMFIALFAMSTVDVTKFKAFAIGFNEALGGGRLDAGIGGAGRATSPVVGQGNGQGPFAGGQLSPNDAMTNSQLASLLNSIASQNQSKTKQRETLADVQKQIDSKAKDLGLGDKVQTKQLNNGLEVTLLTDQVFFSSGQAELHPGGQDLLNVVGAILNTIDNPILINGFTDSQPISTAQFKSNLYLSSARADAVAEFFMAIGVDPNRLSPAGRGALDPVASNATAEGRAKNRRVEIIVQSKLVKTTLENAGINSNAVTPTTLPISSPATPAAAGPSGAAPNLSPGLGAS